MSLGDSSVVDFTPARTHAQRERERERERDTHTHTHFYTDSMDVF